MYKKLPDALKEEVKQKIQDFQNPKNHQTLKVHSLTGRLKNTYSFSVNYKIRIVFQFDKNGKNTNIAYLLYVGSHDEVYH
jgi:mRNA-degrading endonuclease YafQ of YafQ-DinJ toxin-antitoxin module